MRRMSNCIGVFAASVLACAMGGQTANSVIPDRPDPKEIPVPPIKTSMPDMPGVDQLPNRPQMPDVMILNNGHKVKTAKDWDLRRAEMRRLLGY